MKIKAWPTYSPTRKEKKIPQTKTRRSTENEALTGLFHLRTATIHCQISKQIEISCLCSILYMESRRIKEGNTRQVFLIGYYFPYSVKWQTRSPAESIFTAELNHNTISVMTLDATCKCQNKEKVLTHAYTRWAFHHK